MSAWVAPDGYDGRASDVATRVVFCASCGGPTFRTRFGHVLCVADCEWNGYDGGAHDASRYVAGDRDGESVTVHVFDGWNGEVWFATYNRTSVDPVDLVIVYDASRDMRVAR